MTDQAGGGGFSKLLNVPDPQFYAMLARLPESNHIVQKAMQGSGGYLMLLQYTAYKKCESGE